MKILLMCYCLQANFITPPSKLMPQELIQQIIFVSTAAHEMSTKELRTLGQQCLINNFNFGITGTLIYRQGNFIGVIEGKQADVRTLFFDQIVFDHRHHSVDILRKFSNIDRMFANWHMHFLHFQTTNSNQTIDWSSSSEEKPGCKLFASIEHSETRYILDCFCGIRPGNETIQLSSQVS